MMRVAILGDDTDKGGVSVTSPPVGIAVMLSMWFAASGHPGVIGLLMFLDCDCLTYSRKKRKLTTSRGSKKD